MKMELLPLELLSPNGCEIAWLEILLNRMAIIDLTNEAAIRVIQDQLFQICVNRARQLIQGNGASIRLNQTTMKSFQFP
jgi:hypothetical protein